MLKIYVRRVVGGCVGTGAIGHEGIAVNEQGFCSNALLQTPLAQVSKELILTAPVASQVKYWISLDGNFFYK